MAAFGFSTSMQLPRGPQPMAVDPYDALARKARIASFTNYMGAHPGAAPNGTGDTGLQPNDAVGWSKLLDQQHQYVNDLAAENNHAAPTSELDSYGPMVGGGTRMPAAPALKALQSVVGGGGASDTRRGAADGVPSAVLDDPELYKAYTLSLLDKFQGEGRAARRQGMAPADIATENVEADLRTAPYEGAMNREQDYLDTVNKAAAGSRAYFGYGAGVEEDKARRASGIADDKNQSAMELQGLKNASAAEVARITADSRLTAAQKQAQIAALTIQQRDIGSQRQYGGAVDPQAMAGLTSALQGMNQPTAAPPPSAPSGARVLSEQDLQGYIRAHPGSTRDQAIAAARQLGYTVQ